MLNFDNVAVPIMVMKKEEIQQLQKQPSLEQQVYQTHCWGSTVNWNSYRFVTRGYTEHSSRSSYEPQLYSSGIVGGGGGSLGA